MKPNAWPRAIALRMLLKSSALALLLSACGATLPPSPPAVVLQPAIPKLADSARQISARSEPFSRRVERNISSWDATLTKSSMTPAGAAASAPLTTTR